MKIKTILYTIILFCEIGITDTYALGGSDIRHCEPTEESVIINPDESPVLIYSFSKHEVYKLMQGDTCTGLVISDIACEPPEVISASIHLLAADNYTTMDFCHNAELIGRIP